MAWGVLEDRHMASPPGTANLTENKDDPSNIDLNTSNLKRQNGVILQPQPSDDPNDPLNWSPFLKNSIMIILGMSSGVTLALGPMITPGLAVLAMQYQVSLDMVSSFMVGLLSFWTGIATFFTASGASVYGKRPFFIISTAALLATCIWGFAAQSFSSLIAMRVVQGVASAPLETLVTSSVSDLFYVHQRGSRLAIWGVMLGSGVLLGQIISGAIIQAWGVQATFGVTAIILAVLLPLQYFFCYETTYAGPRPTEFMHEEKGKTYIETVEVSEIPREREPFFTRLRLFRGRVTNESFWKGVIRPIPLIIYPAVLFGTIVNGGFFVALIALSILSVNVFMAPPYRLNPGQVGLTNLPNFVVALIFTPLAGILTDVSAKWMAKRNKGVFEPEFRLILLLPAAIMSTVAFVGFGFAVEKQMDIKWLLFYSSMLSASVPFATQPALTYVIDCHPLDANQAFVTIFFMKAVFVFIATTFINGWFFTSGPSVVFNTLAGVNLAVSALTIPAYVFGKRFRSMIARSKMAQSIAPTQ